MVSSCKAHPSEANLSQTSTELVDPERHWRRSWTIGFHSVISRKILIADLESDILDFSDFGLTPSI